MEQLRWARAVAIVATCMGVGCRDDSSPGVPTRPEPPIPRVTSATILAAGDVAMCGTPGAEQTTRLLESTSGTILPLGDLAYFQGSFAQFMSCYEPTWGRLKDRSRPTPGNHE